MTRRRKLPSEPVELLVTALTHEGRGLATLNGKKVFVFGALPGETVLARYTRRSGKYDEADVVDVLEASPDRVTPQCEYFTRCGGCSLQHLEANKQILHKQDAVLNLLQHAIGQDTFEVLPPITGPIFHYRHKARLGIRYVTKKEKLLIGFRERDGRYIMDMDHCHVLAKEFGLQLRTLADLFMSLSIYREIAQIEIAVADYPAMIIRHLSPFSDADITQLKTFAAQENFHIYLQSGGPDTIIRLWPTSGEERLRYHLSQHNVTLQFHPSDFTQINPAVNEKMVSQAISLLDLKAEDEVIDLFCGLGNFTLPMARHCKQVVGVEGSEMMVSRGNENAQINHIDNVAFYAANLEEPPVEAQWYKYRYNKVLLDPPRSGAANMISALVQWKPTHIVYVSCHPATMARDAANLVQAGYKLAKVGVMDMFPHTQHVETMGLFIHA